MRVPSLYRTLSLSSLVICLVVSGFLISHQRNLCKRKVPPGSPGWASTGVRTSHRAARRWNPASPPSSVLSKQFALDLRGDLLPPTPDNDTDAIDTAYWDPRLRSHQANSVQAAKVRLLEGIKRDLTPFSQGITLEMVEQAYCQTTMQVASFRVQILDNRAYIVGESPGFQYLNLRNKQMLASVLEAFPGTLPDVDFVIQGSDWIPPSLNDTGWQWLPGWLKPGRQPGEACQQQGPVFSANKEAHDSHGILFPDESWVGWADAKASILTAAKKLQWSDKDPRLLFRGAPTGDRPFWLGSRPHNTTELDIKLVRNWWDTNRGQYMSPEDQCGSKHLLYFAGYSWASRLKKMLLCGSAVVMHPSLYFGFWWHLLEHGKHVHVMKPVTSRAHAAKELTAVVHALQKNEARTRDMAANGQWLASEVLTPEMALKYWQKLLAEYGRLQMFKPTLHPDAMALNESISQPQESVVMQQTGRTCSVCPRRC